MMLFTGDIAVPNKTFVDQFNGVFQKYADIFNDKLLICNFEGLLASDEYLRAKEPILFNNFGILNALKSRGNVLACLANNHILDLPSHFEDTINAFRKNGISYCGAGLSLQGANAPITLIDHDREVLIFNSCWDFLLYNQANPSNGVYVSEIDEVKLIKSVENSRKEKPDSLIVIYLHWNFDLETLPFPMHRKFAKELINSGANLVVGSHSHCVQGGERYNNGYIVYGLGNFFIPNGIYANGRLRFPEFSKDQLVFEYDPISEKAKCHWFKYDEDNVMHPINHILSETFEHSTKLKAYSPFQEMPADEYLTYFKSNRRKKKFIPVYKDFKNIKTNRIFTYYLKRRAKFARFLAKSNVIKWQN